VGQVSIFKGEQPVNKQQSSEAEDDMLTQVCELEIENIFLLLQCSFCEDLLVLVLVLNQ
jgi:hypothetical protein